MSAVLWLNVQIINTCTKYLLFFSLFFCISFEPKIGNIIGNTDGIIFTMWMLRFNVFCMHLLSYVASQSTLLCRFVFR